MQENLYQNIDISQNNPLDIGETQNTTPTPKISKKLNPKIIILIILGIIFFHTTQYTRKIPVLLFALNHQ